MRKHLTYESDVVSGPLGSVALYSSYMCGCHFLLFKIGDNIGSFLLI